MNLRFLETFVWVARLRSFRLTADKLFTTQASISARIAALEEELGVRLFDRDTRGVQLTPDGHKVLEYADRMVSTLRKMCQRFFMGAGVVAALPVLLAVPAQAGGLCTEPYVKYGRAMFQGFGFPRFYWSDGWRLVWRGSEITNVVPL